jgi:hypothetical protein
MVAEGHFLVSGANQELVNSRRSLSEPNPDILKLRSV